MTSSHKNSVPITHSWNYVLSCSPLPSPHSPFPVSGHGGMALKRMWNVFDLFQEDAQVENKWKWRVNGQSTNWGSSGRTASKLVCVCVYIHIHSDNFSSHLDHSHYQQHWSSNAGNHHCVHEEFIICAINILHNSIHSDSWKWCSWSLTHLQNEFP